MSKADKTGNTVHYFTGHTWLLEIEFSG